MDDEKLKKKLHDAMVPGCVVTLEPEEAERAGAFVEDALGEDEAIDSAMDILLVDRVK